MFQIGFKNAIRVTSQYLRSYSSSALYVTRDNAMETYAVIVPYVDCEQRFKDLQMLEDNVIKRGLSVNVKDIKKVWDFYKEWTASKENIELKRVQVQVEMKKAKELGAGEVKEKEIKRLTLQGKLLREELKNLNKSVSGIEEVVILQVLNLPNDLHPNTSTSEVILKHSTQEKEIKKCTDHLIIGKYLNCIDYRDSVTCYLKNDAAQFELALGSFFKDEFVNEGFIPFMNADFAKSVLVEGVSLLPINPKNALLLKDEEGDLNHKSHLTGCASLFSFCGFHAKQTVQTDSLPAKYITVGQQYNPKSAKNLGGLYSKWQSTAAEIFIILESSNNKMNLEFDKVIELLCKIYGSFGFNFRIVNQPAKLLQPWEGLRSSIQVYSYINNRYVEVGHVSIIDDFISKRLRICYLHKKQDKFAKIISGTVVNVDVLLALCLERSNGSLLFPQVLQKFKIL